MRKIALFSDIHGNYQALKSILSDINNNKYDDVICLGDIVGLGPESSLCLEKIMNSNVIMLLGNHELYQIYGCKIDELNNDVIEHEEWINSTLSPEKLNFLKKCKLNYDVLEAGKLFSFSHFFIKNEKDSYPFYPLNIVKEGNIFSHLNDISCDYFFFGHEHDSFIVNSCNGFANCVGSSGCNSSNITFYTVVEIDNDDVKIYKKYIEYDRKQFEKLMKNSLYPSCDFFAKKFFDINL